MKSSLSGWFAAVIVVLAISSPLSGSAQAVDQRSINQGESYDLLGPQQKVGNHVLLAAVSTAATALTNGPTSIAAAPPPPASSSFHWTGFYVGGHFGRGMGNGNMTVSPLPSAATFVNLGPTKLHPDPTGTIAGAQGGFNWQRGNVVVGVEGDYSASDMNGIKVIRPIIQNNGTPFPGAAPGNNIVSHQDTDWISTVRGRLGVTPVPRLLLYGTGGLAYGHVTYFANTDFKPVGTENYAAFVEKNKSGWSVGAGAEVGLATHFTARFEYLYYDLGNQILHANPNPPLPPFGIDYEWATSAQLIRGGFNFKF
jgi:outer membrane immunogenic protein